MEYRKSGVSDTVELIRLKGTKNKIGLNSYPSKPKCCIYLKYYNMDERNSLGIG